MPTPSEIPPELAAAPAGAVAELLSAEAQMGHPLPALRAVLASRGAYRAAPLPLIEDPDVARWLGSQAERRDRVAEARALVAPAVRDSYDLGARLGRDVQVRARLTDAARRRWTRRIDALPKTTT